MQKVEIFATKPEVIDYLGPFIFPVMILLALQILVLFGLRFTPW